MSEVDDAPKDDVETGEQLSLPLSSSSPSPPPTTEKKKKKKKKRQPRSLKLIAEFDEEGYAKRWRFAVPKAFKDTLDIKLTERKEPVIDEDGEFVYVTKVNVAGRKYTRKKTKAVMRWTQGAEYSFSEGHVIYDTPKAYRVWREALQHISYMVDVLRSTPSKWDEDEGVNIEGSVTFLLQKPNAERTGLETIDQYSMTQTKFVEFLRTGESESIDLR